MVGVHILYWILMFSIIGLFINGYYLFKGDLFTFPVFLYILSPFLCSVITHYFLCYFIIACIRKRKWKPMAMYIFLAYLFLIFSITFSFQLLAHFFPNNEFILKKYQHFRIDSFFKIFSLDSLVLVCIYLMWYNAISLNIKICTDFYESWREKMVIMNERNTIEINFLRAQIQPHFLFNSLNAIYGLVLENENASNAVLHLSDLLRFTLLNSTKETVTLKEEIKFLTNYILLEKMRHQENRVSIDHDFNAIANPEKTIKPLILVNFIENAFKHGINASIKNTWVKIIIVEQDGILSLRISNNTYASIDKSQTGKGLGLINVRRRLELEYHDKYSLDIKETEELYDAILVLKI
jgi:signal transduction histidine kinase